MKSWSVPSLSASLSLLIIFHFAFASTGYCDYRKGLELYKSNDLTGAVREFNEAAQNKIFDGYQEVIREMSSMRPSNLIPTTVNAELLRALGVAAENGPPDIQWQLSRLWRGWGDLPSRREQTRWLILAASGGHAEAGWELWRYRPAGFDNKDRIPWLRRAAELGHVEAQREMVLLQVLPFDERMHWAKVRAEHGDPFGYAWVGYNYARAVPDKRNNEEAVKWLRKAWEAGFRTLPVPHALVKLYDEKLIPDAAEEEVKLWREAARPRVVY